MTWEPILYEKSMRATDYGYHTVVQFAEGVNLPEQGQSIIATIEVMEGIKPARKVVTMTLTDNYWEKIYNICAWMPGRDIPSGISPYQGVCGYSVIDEQMYYEKSFQNRKHDVLVVGNDNKEKENNANIRASQHTYAIHELSDEVRRLRQQLKEKKENQIC